MDQYKKKKPKRKEKEKNGGVRILGWMEEWKQKGMAM